LAAPTSSALPVWWKLEAGRTGNLSGGIRIRYTDAELGDNWEARLQVYYAAGDAAVGTRSWTAPHPLTVVQTPRRNEFATRFDASMFPSTRPKVITVCVVGVIPLSQYFTSVVEPAIKGAAGEAGG